MLEVDFRKITIFSFFFALVSCGNGGYTGMIQEMEVNNAHGAWTSHKQFNYMSDNPHLVAYIKYHGSKLAEHSVDLRNLDYQFDISNEEVLNAVNYGAGVTFMYNGLLRGAETTDEVAMVLGHEAAHTADGHVTANISRQFSTQLIQLAVLIEGDFDQQASDMADLVGALGFYAQMEHSPVAEARADWLGTDWALKAGYNPHYFTDFHSRLIDRNPNLPEAQMKISLRSHPPTLDRINDIKQQVNEVLSDFDSTKNLSLVLAERGFAKEAIHTAYKTRHFDQGDFYRYMLTEASKPSFPKKINMQNYSWNNAYVPMYRLCININTADEARLQKHNQISPGIAASIIGYRSKNGFFSEIKEIKSVPGLTNDIYLSIKRHISTNDECTDLPIREKDSYEWNEEYENILYGTLNAIERWLNYLKDTNRSWEDAKRVDSDLYECIYPATTWREFGKGNQFVWPKLMHDALLEEPEEYRVSDIYACSVPILLHLTDLIMSELEEEYPTASLKILSSFFGTEGPVDISDNIFEIWEELNAGEWGIDSNWILLHLIHGDISRGLMGPLNRYQNIG